MIERNTSDSILDYATPSKNGSAASLARRAFTNIALAGVIAVALLIAGMWLVAIRQGWARWALQGVQGNHGPWRGLYPLEEIWDYALLCTIGVVPISCIGLIVERTPRSGIVAALAMSMLFLSWAHLPLFD